LRLINAASQLLKPLCFGAFARRVFASHGRSA